MKKANLTETIYLDSYSASQRSLPFALSFSIKSPVQRLSISQMALHPFPWQAHSATPHIHSSYCQNTANTASVCMDALWSLKALSRPLSPTLIRAPSYIHSPMLTLAPTVPPPLRLLMMSLSTTLFNFYVEILPLQSLGFLTPLRTQPLHPP